MRVCAPLLAGVCALNMHNTLLLMDYIILTICNHFTKNVKSSFTLTPIDRRGVNVLTVEFAKVYHYSSTHRVMYTLVCEY